MRAKVENSFTSAFSSSTCCTIVRVHSSNTAPSSRSWPA